MNDSTCGFRFPHEFCLAPGNASIHQVGFPGGHDFVPTPVRYSQSSIGPVPIPVVADGEGRNPPRESLPDAQNGDGADRESALPKAGVVSAPLLEPDDHEAIAPQEYDVCPVCHDNRCDMPVRRDVVTALLYHPRVHP